VQYLSTSRHAHTRRTTNGGRGPDSTHSQSQSDFCRRKPHSKLTGLTHLVRGCRADGALVVRLEGRLEEPRIISDVLGQPRGSGSQQISLRKSGSSSLLGELQGTLWH